MKFKMQKVIVTGAASMIGCALIKECIANDIEVLALVRKNSAHLDRLPKSDLIKIYECNLNELINLKITGEYDVFYHLAWDFSAKESRDNPILQEPNIKYTLDAVELARALKCHKFIGAGSQAEYGKVNHVITPDTETAPFSSYGIAKYAAGRLSQKLCEQYGIIHIWGRIFSVYGRNDNNNTMLSYAINQFRKNEIATFTAGTQLWDYLHENDAGRIFYLLGSSVEESNLYCIASGRAMCLKEYILKLADCFNRKVKYEFVENLDGLEPLSLQADISKLIRDIHFHPNTSFEEGIKDMVLYKNANT